MREPIEWRSPQWWRNRPVEERIEFIRPPKRLLQDEEHTDVFDVFVEEWEPGNSLCAIGKSGTGKSIKSYKTALALVCKYGLAARWVSAEQYIEMLKDSFDNDGLLPEEYSSPYTIKNVRGVFDVLVLDGLGDERKTDFAQHEIGTLIRNRWDKMLTTIVTTRLDINDIKVRYGERLAVPLAEFDMEIT